MNLTFPLDSPWTWIAAVVVAILAGTGIWSTINGYLERRSRREISRAELASVVQEVYGPMLEDAVEERKAWAEESIRLRQEQEARDRRHERELAIVREHLKREQELRHSVVDIITTQLGRHGVATNDLAHIVQDLIGEMGSLRGENERLSAEVHALSEQNARLSEQNASLSDQLRATTEELAAVRERLQILENGRS